VTIIKLSQLNLVEPLVVLVLVSKTEKIMIHFKDYEKASLLFVKEELPHLPQVGDYIIFDEFLFIVKERSFNLTPGENNVISIFISRCES
jgi:hypothetical protein